MGAQAAYTTQMPIRNPLGFHVRPVQRFAELAQAFKGDVEVDIEGRKASGKSVMSLMSVRGRHGSIMKITTSGSDGRQAAGLLGFVVGENFFVEDDLGSAADPNRHIARLAKFASCSNSEVFVELDGRKADARRCGELLRLGLKPTSKVEFHVKGEDAEQAERVLELLARRCFYVEEEMGAEARPKANG